MGQLLAKCAKGEQEQTKSDGDGGVSITRPTSIEPNPENS